MNNIKYAVFILTYGRADKVITYNNLRKQGYTGKIFLVCSDDDKSINDYKEKYGEAIVLFNKELAGNKFDIGDNFENKKVVVYARNEVFDIAKNLGYENFIVMDDDYNSFHFLCNEIGEYEQRKCKNLNNVFSIYFKYFLKTNCLCIAPIQGGDLIGGKRNSMFSGGLMKRKVMNVWFLTTKRRFNIVGRINEDTSSYVLEGNRGGLFLQVPDFRIDQNTTQSSSGGLTEFYLETGTYQKSFYSVMFSPSCVKIALMNSTHKRLHHQISWNNTCSKIIREKHKRS